MIKLDHFLATQKIPHIIFYGPTGSGKRTVLLHLLKMIYPPEQDTNSYIMYVNCAHGKGIRFIRDELKFFARRNIHNANGKIFKSIVLFNADNLTVDAQSALRRCIEEFSHTTRFFVVVEKRTKLLNPILSRFCNIYIPLPRINGSPTSLHKLKRASSASAVQRSEDKRQSWLAKKVQALVLNPTRAKTLTALESFYQRAYSGLDLLALIRRSKTIPPVRKSTLVVFADMVRKEFIHEKLLMFLLLELGFMRPTLCLENIEKL